MSRQFLRSLTFSYEHSAENTQQTGNGGLSPCLEGGGVVSSSNMKHLSLLLLTGLLAAACTGTKEPAPETAAAPEAPPAPAESPKAEPTPEQQATAHELLNTADAAAPNELSAEELAPTPSDLSTGGLRLRRFAPPEEASSEGAAEPLPNAAELHGLRSPVLRGNTLPMDINGKLTPNQEGEER